MKLHDLSPAKGSRRDSVRRGRGGAARRGEKSGSGTKGQKKRNQVPIYFEGGQTPLYRRLPKRGFHSINSTTYQVVNLYQLNRFDDGEEINPDVLREAGLIDGDDPVKILGEGNLDVKSLEIEVHALSSSARGQIEEANGSIDILSTPGD